MGLRCTQHGRTEAAGRVSIEMSSGIGRVPGPEQGDHKVMVTTAEASATCLGVGVDMAGTTAASPTCIGLSSYHAVRTLGPGIGMASASGSRLAHQPDTGERVGHQMFLGLGCAYHSSMVAEPVSGLAGFANRDAGSGRASGAMEKNCLSTVAVEKSSHRDRGNEGSIGVEGCRPGERSSSSGARRENGEPNMMMLDRRDTDEVSVVLKATSRGPSEESVILGGEGMVNGVTVREEVTDRGKSVRTATLLWQSGDSGL